MSMKTVWGLILSSCQVLLLVVVFCFFDHLNTDILNTEENGHWQSFQIAMCVVHLNHSPSNLFPEIQSKITYIYILYTHTYMLCCCSVTKACLILCNTMDCTTPYFPVLHYCPEFAQNCVH